MTPRPPGERATDTTSGFALSQLKELCQRRANVPQLAAPVRDRMTQLLDGLRWHANDGPHAAPVAAGAVQRLTDALRTDQLRPGLVRDVETLKTYTTLIGAR